MSQGPGPEQDQPQFAARRVAKNTAYLVVAEIASKAMMFVFFMLAARWLGTEQFGVFSFALAYVSMFSVFADLGLGVVTAREIARDPGTAKHYIDNCLAMKLVVSVVLSGLVIGTIRLLGYPAATVKVTAISSLFIVANAIVLYYAYVFQGFERMSLSAIARVVQTAVMLAGVLLVTRGAASVSRFAWLYVAGTGVGAAFAWATTSLRLVRPGLGFNLAIWRRLLRTALPVGMAAVLAMLYYWNGSIFLSKIRGNAEVGVYNAPFRLVLGFGFVAFAFAAAIYPVMSRLHLTSSARLSEVVTTAVRYMAVLAAALGILGVFLARPMVVLLYGTEYLRSVPVMAILVWWVGFIYLNAVLSNYFYAINKPKTVAQQAGIGLGVNLLLNLVLIPLFGAVGAAVSLAATEGLSTVFLLVKQHRSEARIRLRYVASVLPRVVAAAVLASVTGWFVALWNSALGLVVAGIVCTFLLFAVGAFGRQELGVVLSLVRRRRG